jgi:hypothetical protein
MDFYKIEYINTFIICLAIIGIVTSSVSTLYTNVEGIISGYSITAGSFLLLFILTFVDLIKKNISTSQIVSLLFAIFVLIVICSALLILNLKNKKAIKEGKVAKEYYIYNSIVTLFIIIQTLILLNNISNISKMDTTGFSMISTIIGLINLIFVSYMFIILTFFSTDG